MGVCEEVFTTQGCDDACPEGEVCSVKVRGTRRGTAPAQDSLPC